MKHCYEERKQANFLSRSIIPFFVNKINTVFGLYIVPWL